jgi:hypothetical protein
MNEKNCFNKAKRQVTMFKKHDYIEILDQRSAVILENVFFSIKSSIEGLENKPLKASEVNRLKDDILQLLEISQSHIYRISNFFEDD